MVPSACTMREPGHVMCASQAQNGTSYVHADHNGRDGYLWLLPHGDCSSTHTTLTNLRGRSTWTTVRQLWGSRATDVSASPETLTCVDEIVVAAICLPDATHDGRRSRHNPV